MSYSRGQNKSHGSGGTGPGVPSRWLNCPRKSDGFIANKFLVFKTPLDSRYDDLVPSHARFPPKMILEHVKLKNKRIGLWIDLTNTSRFYSSSEITNSGAEYFKLQCRGHGETPSVDQTATFVSTCRDFMQRNDDDIIGVHCTHGFNRSGFLICAFLQEEFGFSIRVAVTSFAKLRPPGIYKQDYVNQLWDLYGDEDDGDPMEVEPLPDWCHEEDSPPANNYNNSGHSGSGGGGGGQKRMLELEDGNGEDAAAGQSNGNGKRRKEFVKENPVFMTGVEGVEPLTGRELSDIQKLVQNMCGWTSSGFPGSQPVSMDTQNIYKLVGNPYWVSWKADGTRYLLLILDRHQIFFIDRDNCVFRVHGMTFPTKKVHEEHLRNTLVDGEMVMDVVNGVNTPRFLIYDVIKFEGLETGKVDFRRRLSCIKDEIVNPRYAAITRGLVNRLEEPFGVRLKEFWPADQAAKILNGDFMKQLLHEPDGLIFQPERDPYECGRCDQVLKWKPPELNTIDFRLKVCKITGEGILPTTVGELYVGQLSTPFAFIKPLKRSVAQLDGKIVECNFEIGKGWCFMRERTDKSFPNAYKTAAAVAASIKNPVRKDYLLDFIARKGFRKDTSYS